MASKNGSSDGSVFFNKQRKKWNAQYKAYDITTGKLKPKTKSFETRADAISYLNSIMYQKENPLYIKHNGIPLKFLPDNILVYLQQLKNLKKLLLVLKM